MKKIRYDEVGPVCGGCKFWKWSDYKIWIYLKGDDEGECRKNAPKPVCDHRLPRGCDDRQLEAIFTVWPKTQFNDWCGEFQMESKTDQP